MKNYKDALRYIDDAIKLNPEIDFYNNRGNIYKAMGDCKNAIQDYNLIIEKDSVYSGAYYGIALCENELNLYNEAIDDLTKFIEFKPNEAIALLNRGQIFINLKDYESACKDFEKSFSLGEYSTKELIAKYCK